jgi:hypothetical protein
MKEALGVLFVGPLWFATMLAGPVTYIVSVLDTWHRGGSPIANIIMNLTVDAFLGAFWPLTWVLWGIYYLTGHHTPFGYLLG